MRRITTPSFKDVEGERKFTLPNMLSVTRGAGGLALGGAMAFNLIDPATAAYAAAGLAATDAEGSVIVATRSFPRLQKALRIIPSRWGRVLDPVADKIYAMGIFAGGMANQAIPLEQGLPVMGTEIATVGATAVATHLRGGEVPEVGQVNKLSMVARMQMIAGDLGAQAVHGGLHDILVGAGKAGFVGSVLLGSGSIINILRQGRQAQQEA